MTGYGKAVATFNEKKIHVEVKSLNSKQLDLTTRIVPLYREKEMELRQLVAKALERGKVEFAIWTEKVGGDAAQINASLAENYFRQMKQMAEKFGIPEPQDWFQTLMRMPDVTTRTEAEVLGDDEWEVVSAAVGQALDALIAFRRQEGAALERKFAEKIDNIEQLLAQIEPYEQLRVEKIRQRIVEGLNTIPGVDYDKNRLEQELIYYSRLRQESLGTGTDLLHRKARHQRGKTASDEPSAIFPRDDGRTLVAGQKTRFHRAGNGS